MPATLRKRPPRTAPTASTLIARAHHQLAMRKQQLTETLRWVHGARRRAALLRSKPARIHAPKAARRR